jgi:tRNA nucleotidyltransferase/poly(A) polymerase
LSQRKPEEVIYTDSIVEDANRRDFTFNAIYYEPLKKEYVDPVDGINDLKK